MASADDLSALTTSLSSWEVAGYIAVAAVAIGVAGEVIHDFLDSFKSFVWWREKGNKASALLLVMALVAELVIQIKANSISGRIIASLNDKAASATERAAALGITVDNLQTFVTKKQNEADKQLNAFKLYADEQKQRNDAVIAELKSDDARLSTARDDALTAAIESKDALEKMTTALDAERAVRDKMIAIMRPRSLAEAQQERITALMKSFSGTQFDIAVIDADPDAAALLIPIQNMLRNAGWQQIDWKGGDLVLGTNKPVVGLATAAGVFIVFVPPAPQNVADATVALGRALNAEGISTQSGQIGPGFINPTTGVVHIVIGRKV